jgi:hypothetical protein
VKVRERKCGRGKNNLQKDFQCNGFQPPRLEKGEVAVIPWF